MSIICCIFVFMKKIGIYKITSPNNKIYIGQSINIEKRFKQYYSFNKSNKSQIKLWRSLKKYGCEKHIFEIIEECEFENLNIKERYWQEYYNVIDRNKGLNLVLVKTNEKPRKLSEETKRKMSISAKGKKKKPFSKIQLQRMSDSHKGKSFSRKTRNKMGISILQYDKDLNLINEYPTITEASDITKVHLSNIQRVCKGERKTAGGYIWKYKNENDKRKKYKK